MKISLASADANILGHLYRSGMKNLIYWLFEQVMVDEYIWREIIRRQKDVLSNIEQDLKEGSFLVLVDRAELKSRKLTSIYDDQLKEMKYLFLPSDEGEKHAIALALATGAGFLLTDDEKDDGPYKTIEHGIVSNLEALGFFHPGFYKQCIYRMIRISHFRQSQVITKENPVGVRDPRGKASPPLRRDKSLFPSFLPFFDYAGRV